MAQRRNKKNPGAVRAITTSTLSSAVPGVSGVQAYRMARSREVSKGRSRVIGTGAGAGSFLPGLGTAVAIGVGVNRGIDRSQGINPRNAKTGVRTAKPAKVGTQNRVGPRHSNFGGGK